MTSTDPRVYTREMHEAAQDSIVFLGSATREAFITDRKTQQAVVMSLMIIGEAAARAIDKCPEFVAANPEIPWIAMRGLRNRIAHGYFQIDMEIVWETTRSALPDLIRKLRDLDPRLNSSAGRSSAG